ncbi:MAG: hypothetical protein IKS41_06080 [Alphaproteobacteria bacterium]|nr:hypothetical protein [Alphaproteobacteria bacterium]
MVEINTDEFERWYKQGNAFLEKKLNGAALTCYIQALKIFPASVEVLSQLASLYSDLGQTTKAYKAYQRIVKLNGDDTPLIIRSQFLKLEKKFLFWDTLNRDVDYFLQDEVLYSGRINPFDIRSFLPVTDEQLYKATRAFVSETSELRPQISPFHFEDRKPSPQRLKLGFLCADCRVHPTGYVIGEFFERIDRQKFDVYLYDIYPQLETYPSKRIYGIKDIHIAPLDKLSDKDAAERIFKDKIDVLIDMNGFTMYNRLGIMTYQPAPAQGTFLGCIGTLGGVPGIDYHFVDKYSVLPGEDKYYYEKLKYLEPSSWLIDHNIELPQYTPLKKHMGFKSDAIVLCCFNNSYKFTPNYFDLWARILKRVPKAVLWFYSTSKVFEDNVSAEFEKRHIDRERIVHAKLLPHHEHLARYKIADLLLDTELYNAHTTGMEALFMGCPVITCPGTTHASRVGGALLTALDVPEMICKDIKEYEEKVVELCTTPGALKKLREKVTEKAKTADLFNMEKFTKSFEKAVQEMYQESLNTLE